MWWVGTRFLVHEKDSRENGPMPAVSAASDAVGSTMPRPRRRTLQTALVQGLQIGPLPAGAGGGGRRPRRCLCLWQWISNKSASSEASPTLLRAAQPFLAPPLLASYAGVLVGAVPALRGLLYAALDADDSDEVPILAPVLTTAFESLASIAVPLLFLQLGAAVLDLFWQSSTADPASARTDANATAAQSSNFTKLHTSEDNTPSFFSTPVVDAEPAPAPAPAPVPAATSQQDEATGGGEAEHAPGATCDSEHTRPASTAAGSTQEDTVEMTPPLPQAGLCSPGAVLAASGFTEEGGEGGEGGPHSAREGTKSTDFVSRAHVLNGSDPPIPPLEAGRGGSAGAGAAASSHTILVQTEQTSTVDVHSSTLMPPPMLQPAREVELRLPPLYIVAMLVAQLVMAPLLGWALVLLVVHWGWFDQHDPLVVFMLLFENSVPTSIPFLLVCIREKHAEAAVAQVLLWGHVACLLATPIWATLFIDFTNSLQ